MKNLSRFAVILFSIVLFVSCHPDTPQEPKPILTADISGIFANDWFGLCLKLTKETDGFTAPVAARAFGYTGLTLYEAVVPGMPDFQSLQGHLDGFSAGTLPTPEAGQTYHWGLCANSAMAALTKRLYKTASANNLNAISAMADQYDQFFSKDLDPQTIEQSNLFGEALGKAMYEFSVSDGHDAAYGDNYPSAYIVPVFPGAWKPTPPANEPIPLQPYWGSVRPFLSVDVTETQPDDFPVYSTSTSSVFFAQALEVYASSVGLSAEKAATAQYWNDDPGKTATPAGHSISILQQILTAEKANLAVAAEAYAKVGMGVHDAFVSCWKTKYDHSLLRPVSYIRAQLDPGFNSLLTTAPVPEYTSEHAVQSAATAQILSDLFGFDYHFTDHTNADRSDIDGSPRSFNTFMDYADEAAGSRLFGGVHYQASIGEGMKQGLKIGRNIGGMAFRR